MSRRGVIAAAPRSVGTSVCRRRDRILRRVAKQLGYEPPGLLESLLNDALNPNDYRLSLLEEVQQVPFGIDLA